MIKNVLGRLFCFPQCSSANEQATVPTLAHPQRLTSVILWDVLHSLDAVILYFCWKRGEKGNTGLNCSPCITQNWTSGQFGDLEGNILDCTDCTWES